MYIWVTGLLLALGAGVYIGSIRFELVVDELIKLSDEEIEIN